MSNARDKMNQALKQFAVPTLRALGFRGSFPHFRRVHDTHADLIVFQFNRYGGSFVVEIGIITVEQISAHWKANLTLSTATVYDTNNRNRLGAEGKADHWFEFSTPAAEVGNDVAEPDSYYECIARQVGTLIESEATHWWEAAVKS